LFAEDILGDGPGPFARHSKQYRDFHAMRQHMQQERVSAFREYIADVQTQAFPGPEHVIQAGPELVNAFLEKIEKPG
jgi:3-methyl-2-oxobutanoate hydroxymethyltransferase